MEDEDKTKDQLINELCLMREMLEQCNYAERYLHDRTRSLLTATLESTADGILVVDIEGRITYYNQKFVDMWKIPVPLLQTKDDALVLSYAIEQLSTPDEFIKKVNELYKNPSETSFDVVELKNGSIFERYSQPQKMEDKILGRVWSFRDITMAKASERKLKKSEKRYRQLVELHHAGIWVADKDGCTTYVNPAMAAMMGYTAEEMIGHKTEKFMDDEDKQIFIANTNKLRDGIIEQVETKLNRKDGSKLYIKVEPSPIFNEEGAYEGVIGGIIDISARKLVEQELRHAQKMESIGQLAGGVAHDFNNIISSIINYVYLIKRKISDITKEELQDFVDEIRASAERAANLTKSLLVFSRKHVFEFHTVNLVDIVNRMKLLLVNLIGEDIELEISLSGDDLPIYGDGNQIEMMLMNLAANARDAMVSGGKLAISLKKVKSNKNFIKLQSVQKSQGYALLRVTDTGTGMDGEIIKNIFDPFFTTKEVGKGTGLGLSTVYGIVKQHKGYIDVNSELNKGTTFSIYIPLIDNFITNAESLSRCEPDCGKGRILVAEDDETLRNVTSQLLTRAGYEVITAADGEEVVKLYSENNADLIIMDIIMPKMNGKAAYDKIIKMNKDAKVLFVSGYTDVYLENKLIKDAQFNYITKPIDVGKLLTMIKEMINC
ncbi:PAS domain-containing hybrid sensor histidine kinase/response regulator [Candidatus Magnetominusculus dajiuhuensis]|uniref:PAS domain-containing hybrid sensor histidine kinase/response regulator n=1 Tax=Candidatus Magnetominusculus dajiuhuensis TaxID=3137712 RepID=UPI003B43661E